MLFAIFHPTLTPSTLGIISNVQVGDQTRIQHAFSRRESLCIRAWRGCGGGGGQTWKRCAGRYEHPSCLRHD